MIESIDDLIVFLRHFHRNILEDPSLPPEQIPDDLPEGLAKIYRKLGGLVNLVRYPHPFATQDRLIPVRQIQRVYGTTIFCCENQYCWAACFPSGQEDPPVYLREMLSDRWDEDVVIVCDSLNHFLTTLCLQESVFGSRNRTGFRWTDNILEKLDRENFQPLWLDGKYVDGNWLYNFYISEDRDILIMNDGWIASQTRSLDIFNPDIERKNNVNIDVFDISLSRRYWTKFSNWKAEWLLDEDNAEIRRVLIEQLGYEEICDKLGAISIDSWREYILLKLDNMQIIYDGREEVGREPMVLLKMTCPSTNHIHILRVPPEMTSAEAAITWVNHGIHPDEFAVQT